MRYHAALGALRGFFHGGLSINPLQIDRPRSIRPVSPVLPARLNLSNMFGDPQRGLPHRCQECGFRTFSSSTNDSTITRGILRRVLKRVIQQLNDHLHDQHKIHSDERKIGREAHVVGDSSERSGTLCENCAISGAVQHTILIERAPANYSAYSSSMVWLRPLRPHPCAPPPAEPTSNGSGSKPHRVVPAEVCCGSSLLLMRRRMLLSRRQAPPRPSVTIPVQAFADAMRGRLTCQLGLSFRLDMDDN